ncbi:MAG: cobalt-precorrin-6A reductase [Pseudomonadota bacterium]
MTRNGERRARILVLGGTTEARTLCEVLATRPDIAATASLAGVTERPLAYAVPVRRGGFGGGAGLAAFLRSAGTDLMIDATHPFAATMSANAAGAAALTGVPLCHLQRAPWADDVPRFDSVASAISALPEGAVAFMATGRGSAADAVARPTCRFVQRAIEPVPDLPAHVTALSGRPPFTEDDERRALLEAGATHLIVKDSGGQSGRAKLRAAAELGLPILMVDRPTLPPGNPVAVTVAEAIAWIETRISPDAPSPSHSAAPSPLDTPPRRTDS